MTNRICIRRPDQAHHGDVILARPAGYAPAPPEAGTWIVTACTQVNHTVTRIDYYTPDGDHGVLALTAEQWIAVCAEAAAPMPERLLTETERDSAFACLSEDDCGHITAYLASQHPAVFDAAIAALARYRTSLQTAA